MLLQWIEKFTFSLPYCAYIYILKKEKKKKKENRHWEKEINLWKEKYDLWETNGGEKNNGRKKITIDL